MPLVTSPAPQFSAQAVVGQEIKSLSWEEIHEGKWLCLFFYPLDFTFVCPTEIVAFSEAAGKFAEIGAKVAAVSVGIVDGEARVDLPYLEDAAAEVDMNVVLTGKGELIEVQGSGEGATFSREQHDALLDLAFGGAAEIIRRQRAALDAAIPGSGT